MLERLSIENFTVFSKANFEFAAGLNVIVGENGTGKSHLLKLAYSVISASAQEGRKAESLKPSRTLCQRKIANKLYRVLRPEALGYLVNHGSKDRCHIEFCFDDVELNTTFSLSKTSRSEVDIEITPKKWETESCVFFPARELMSIYPGFVSLYESYVVEFDETFRDTCSYLGRPVARRPKITMPLLEEIMGGKLKLESNGRFYLVTPDKHKIEMHLIAEGYRKIAMLARLIATDVLMGNAYLFWDEPEANLNPRVIKKIAWVIRQLVSRGIQIFVATHSYFLLKELDILTMEQPIPTRYFSLLKGEDGVVVESGDSLDDLQTIVALDEELAQFDREQDAHHA